MIDKPYTREGTEHLTLFYLISEKRRQEEKSSPFSSIGENLRFMESER